VALTVGRERGAEVRFIDLPSWHPALVDRRNRYADAEQRYADAVGRLCRTFAVDNVDALWDHLFESGDGPPELAERCIAYFDLIRGDCAAGAEDTAREAYMADWIAAAVADAGDRPVVVVTGGFHRPALIRLVDRRDPAAGSGWPPRPSLPEGALGGSFLVPYSFKRLDAFDGYQSGMPSPGYYQRLWEHGPASAADGVIEAVVGRLRKRRQVVSTADLIAARAMATGLARLRGHRHPSRTDVLDGLVSALVSESLEVPPPWTARGQLAVGTHPAVVEMVAALSGDRVGRLHPDTPAPPLVHDVAAELERHELTGPGQVYLDLTVGRDRERSRILHRLRVIDIPGYRRDAGPATGVDPVLEERWGCASPDTQLSALIEAGAYGATLLDAAGAVLEERTSQAGGDIDRLATVLFDAALCGIGELSDRVLAAIAGSIGAVADLGRLGRVLAIVLGLWRHDRLLGTARSATLGAVITAGVTRVLWLAEGVRGGAAPADLRRLGAVAATRDAMVHAGAALDLDRGAATAVMGRLTHDPAVPPDLRGAAFGFCWSLGGHEDAARAVRGVATPALLGDWLAGLFALAREDVLDGRPEDAAGDGVLAVLDELLAAMDERDFLIALPALRQAFGFFPPRERETIARQLLDRRGLRGSARSLVRGGVDHAVLLRARMLETQVDALLAREGLLIRQEEPG
jgi:hypothetical protein